MKYEKISETKYNIGENTAEVIEHHIIYVVTHGKQTMEHALAYQTVCKLLSEQVDAKINYLINLNDCGKNEPGTREVWQQLASHENTRKVGIYGMNPVSRVIASFVIGVYHKQNMRFFNTKDEALDWIQTK